MNKIIRVHVGRGVVSYSGWGGLTGSVRVGGCSGRGAACPTRALQDAQTAQPPPVEPLVFVCVGVGVGLGLGDFGGGLGFGVVDECVGVGCGVRVARVEGPVAGVA